MYTVLFSCPNVFPTEPVNWTRKDTSNKSYFKRFFCLVWQIRRNKAVCIFPKLSENILNFGKLESISWKESSNSNFRRTWLLQVKPCSRGCSPTRRRARCSACTCTEAECWESQLTSEWRHCLDSIVGEKMKHVLANSFEYITFMENKLHISISKAPHSLWIRSWILSYFT